jgi:hypothetical protein
MKPLGARFAYRKPANLACVNLPCQISAWSTSNLTPSCICSLTLFSQIFYSLSLTKLDRLSTLDLLTRLNRMSIKLSSCLRVPTLKMCKGRCLEAGLRACAIAKTFEAYPTFTAIQLTLNFCTRGVAWKVIWLHFCARDLAWKPAGTFAYKSPC